MKVMYVTDALAIWGGIERVLSDKANALVRYYGYEVCIVTTDQGDHPIPYPLDERIVMKDLSIRFHQQYKYRGFKRLKKYCEFENLFKDRMKACLEELRPDVISCFRDGNINSICAVKGDIPLIFESHAMYLDIEYENSTFIHKLVTNIHRKKFKHLNKIVTLTKGDARDWSRVCKNVCVIPNVVHLNETGCRSSCNSKNIIFAGRFDIQKDHASLLQIWSLVQKKFPDWTLNVYGNGELKKDFEQQVSALRLNIRIHPAVPDIFDKYLDSSMLIMTSLYEPFGLVLVEAMSCGLPVVAFNCPYGPADIIKDGIDGFLVENRNIQAFSDRICQLIEDKTLRCKMGDSALLAAQRFRFDMIMPEWCALFEQLVSRS